MKKTVGAIIKSDSAFEVNLSGFVFKWEPKPKDDRCNPFECFVPLVISRLDDFGKVRVICENFPDHLLNHKGNGTDRSYPNLTLVQVVEEDEISQAPVIEQKTADDE
jgi:hypothetical protein